MWRRLAALIAALVISGLILSVLVGSSVVQDPGSEARVAPGTLLSALRYGPGPSDFVDVKFPDVSPIGVIVWFHEGGWIAGSRTTTFAHDIPRWLLAHGWVIATADYRLTRVNEFGSTVNAFPAAVHDAQRAIEWIDRHMSQFGIPRKVLLAGASSGANIALVASLARPDVSKVNGAPPHVDGVLSIVGPTDVEAMYRTFAPIFSAAAALYGGCNLKLAGGNSRKCVTQAGFAASMWRTGVAWNLVRAVSSGDRIPPVYFIGGLRDLVVSPESQIDPIVPLWRNLSGNDQFVETDVVKNAGHNLTSQMIDARKLATWLARVASGKLAVSNRVATQLPLREVHLERPGDRLPQEPAIAH